MTKDDYIGIRIPKPLMEKIDLYLEKHPEYISRSDLIKEAIRMHLKEINEK